MNYPRLVSPQLREKTKRYCEAMQEIAGVNPLEKRRFRPIVMTRTMVANALLSDGYSQHAVGTVLGIDHAVVNHYKNRMWDILEAPGYEAERVIWSAFSKKIKEEGI